MSVTVSWQAKSKKESQRKILEALMAGAKTWSELVEATRLSKHTLYNHFPEMEREELIRRELDAKPGSRAKILYALTEKGRQRIAVLRDEMFTELMSNIFVETIPSTFGTLKRYLKALMNIALAEEYRNCVSFTLSYDKEIGNEEKLEERVRTALSYLLIQCIDKPEDLEELSEVDFKLAFRFDRSAVTKILLEKEDVRITREPIIRLPPRPEVNVIKKEKQKQQLK